MFSNRNICIGTFILLFSFMQILWPVPLPTNQLFMVLGMALVLLQSMNGSPVIKWSCVLFLGSIVLSIVSNDIPSFFKPWQRFAQFLFLMIAASPMFGGADVERLRRHMTMGVLWSCGLIGVMSFVAYLTGKGAYLSGIIQGYMGITAHPNFLGMFVMIAMVWFATLFFRSTEMRERIIWLGCWISCLIVILLSASRASTACAMLGSLSVVYLRYRKNSGKMFTAAVILVLILIAAIPFLMPYAETMLQKGVGTDASETDELVAATRGSIWELRIMEMKESPLVGVGAFGCDINLPNADVFYTAETGTVEQGSSYLGLLSQLGWFGFLTFMSIFLSAMFLAYKFAVNQNTPYAQLMLSLMIPMSIHMIVEGYAITAGAVQCVILWFVIGSASQCDKVADYPVFWEDEDPITPQEYEAWRAQQEG